ncbi:Alpha/Beta hydrolase protein [Mycena albidolilacea]|uniref:Alpha/Beta hydrolase protein n=1 Tax=Mycena albidolilacea TaxID=1033008 RepID=A0AAD7AJL1_9AGAR|nr:Alpha/Beta hydrolase protein [Mycena albidolilacea]
MTESSFKIAVPDALLDQLRQKLALVTFPDELEGAGWEYGVPLADVKRLVARWSNGYDWRHHEAQLNKLPQFTRPVSVDGHGTLTIHYVHQKSAVPGAIPLLFVHGWPGSFLEARKIVPLLAEKSADHPSFHVVVLGLPGYGFSEGASKPGFDIAQYAEVGLKLMLALGYDEFVTQGGDWGHPITRMIARLYGGKHSKAWHTNMPAVGAPPSEDSQPELTPKEQEALARNELFLKRGRGYATEQSTQPQTLGYALSDSPVGLLAWIYEKLVNWTDAYPWDDDEVLTWISVFWFSRAGPAASLRIYFEAGNRNLDQVIGSTSAPVIPLGISYFPKELLVFPKSWTRKMGNIVFEREHDSGGHFAAYEKPNELVDDLRQMFGKNGPASGVVSGKSGYAAEKSL